MSVDTYLRGKNTSRYTRLVEDGLEILLAPSLVRWAEDIEIDVRSSLFFRQGFAVHVEHRHTAACRH